MKKIYLTILSVAFAHCSFAQISITNNEMPSAGDTARITLATINPFINYAATGANHTWNFANLRNNGQDLKSYLSVNSTNVIYSLYFSNLPFNPNRANVATTGTAIPANPLLTITDPYNFYYRSSSVYKQVGFGAEVSSIPLPVAFSQQDIIYNLPLYYGVQDTSNSAWNIGLPGVGYYGFAQTRINNVDGWGTLTTPHGTFNVLRVKTELIAKDTIGVDSLGLNFALDRPKTTEYKWLANNEIVPVMQITTTEILGLEIVTEVFYRDDYNTVQPGTLNTAYCAGSTVTIPYIATGSYNAPAFLQAGNVFTAQLSDSTGSFANPVNIGNVTATVSGNVTVTIPANTPPGGLYRIRFISSSPAGTGGDNGFDITIETPALSSITSIGTTTFCAGDSVHLQSTSTANGYSYQWQLSGVDIANANTIDLYANTSGLYTLNTTNSCGTVASNPVTVNVNALPVAAITPPVSTSFCMGDSLLLNAVADSSYTYQWQLNGVDITGEVLSSYMVTQAGDYSVVVSNGLCGSDTSLALTVTVNPLPVATVTANGNTTVCGNDSVVLTAGSGTGYTYQWQLNGVDISGETQISYAAVASGNYTAVVTNSCGNVISNAIAVTVYPVTPAPVISLQSDSLVSTSAVTYQWYYNGVLIVGATDGNYVPTQNGDYTVVITDANGCTSTSAIFTMTTVGMTEINNSTTVSLFPNPASGLLTITGNSTSASIVITILMPSGQVVKEVVENVNGKRFNSSVDVSKFAAGIYVVKLQNEDSLSYMKFVKK